MRVLGGILLVAAEEVRPINANLYIAASILEFSGLSPLLLATLGFVRTMYVAHVISPRGMYNKSIQCHKRVPRGSYDD